MAISMTRTGGQIIPMLGLIVSQTLPHYSIEYRKHFTKFHATVVEAAGGIKIGATEALLIMYGLQWFFALHPKTNEICSNEIDLREYGVPFIFTIGDSIVFSTFILGV
jgi:hypothetical protein